MLDTWHQAALARAAKEAVLEVPRLDWNGNVVVPVVRPDLELIEANKRAEEDFMNAPVDDQISEVEGDDDNFSEDPDTDF